MTNKPGRAVTSRQEGESKVFFISELFYTSNRDYVIQKVGNTWLLYNGITGEYIKDFTSLAVLQKYIDKRRAEK